ncbi:MAG: APC family permease [bacterium]
MSSTATKHTKLGQLASTAICGNDIMSSVLYVSGIAIGVSGVYAPFVLIFIGIVLFIYKGVYREVVESLPVNGGAYNALLNGTTKKTSAIAGVLTILSYVATCVISGKSAVEYLNTLLKMEHWQVGPFAISPVLALTSVVLVFFAFLVISGVKDSAKVALGIFLTHLMTLVAFVVLGGIYLLGHSNQFQFNLDFTKELVDAKGLLIVLFLGFSASLLGVSGFESSANFVEEQQKGVFKKTLRNMLIGVIIFNPLVAIIALNLNTVPEITANKDFLLAEEAKIIGGNIFQYILVIDAFLVLCGAVLTSFVGVSGLVNRMSLDEVLPLWFSKENKKGSFPRIILTFLLLCVSILFATQGDLLALGGVYAISFLSVMSMFAIGNVILKINRPDLKRYYNFPMFLVLIAAFATITGVLGNILLDGKNLIFFLTYFIPFYIFTSIFMARDRVAVILHKFSKKFPAFKGLTERFFNHVTKGKYIFFIHHPSRLYDALKYIDQNETGRTVTIIHCKDKDDEINEQTWKELKQMMPTLPKAGVLPHLNVTLTQHEGKFGPEIIDEVAKKFGVMKNRIFIGSIHEHHNFDYDELGGVRIII